ncbi:uncharacterized protein LOC113238239 [Hyposmocoma kahamanoa]|uniref:uncharacterized protein LOC113238239 n=1 Tax=Hyposmocoma kahamanoa TaxID=1477025 RepID=UPI000E6D9CB1|nr:uncharacterized protein LOC113238239 [Hyposmocoma kahamanoa]
MACCCAKSRCCKVPTVCLGRCDLPKHKCLSREEVQPGPIPKHMGWLYTAKGAPRHQLRCGWRPGHISNIVLRKIAAHQRKCGVCMETCAAACNKTNLNPCGIPPKCSAPAQQKKKISDVSSKSETNNTKYNESDPHKSNRNLSGSNKTDPYATDLNKSEHTHSESNKLDLCKSETYKAEPCCTAESSAPYLRVIRHAGRYSIITDPPDNSPSGPYPLKYVLNCDPNEKDDGVKFSLEAKYNDYCFDYTSSQTSFVLDFSPPEQRCYKPCPKDPCIPCAPSCLAPC